MHLNTVNGAFLILLLPFTTHNFILNPRETPVYVTTITVSPAIPSKSPQFVSEGAFTSAILNSTNFFRSEHNALALTYNVSLEGYATDYLGDGSNNTACDFKHSGGPYGENLAIGCSDAQSCVDAWGNERAKYDFSNPNFSEDTGHFTQLVWKNTTSVGCGRKLCNGADGTMSGWYLVCEYYPRGNVIGQFADEVGPQVNGTPSSTTDNAAHSLQPRLISLSVGLMLFSWILL
ncbi:CAP domain-containing protein [Diplogelasinospora grovesii]|uniref:CAP domain-containing protein n=1 Tax=Diplogelasinospora grovesii TaxID=303347 RepID=A0AAN6NCX0_9PEZI|nr:CAP domain-containing protein [Diplogelasinospora grovesii]